LVITHGGLNTTLETLCEGLPLIVLPIANDQPGIAARIAYLGLGEFIPVQKLTAAKLRPLVVRMLNTPKYRERTSKFAKQLRLLNGPARAADLIETAFKTRQRFTHNALLGSSR
jgi:UDP:flavonoid glycosyltransferase YjiC (YdhE family)